LKWTLQNAQQGFISSFSSVAAVQAAPDPSCLAGGEGVALTPDLPEIPDCNSRTTPSSSTGRRMAWHPVVMP